MAKRNFCHFFLFLFSKIVPINSLFLPFLDFLRNFLFHLKTFQSLVKDLENLLAFLQIFNATMCKWTVQFEASQTKFTGTRFFWWLEVINKFHMFRELVENFNKKFSLRKRMMMLKTTIGINTNRIKSAVVDRHDSVGPAV